MKHYGQFNPRSLGTRLPRHIQQGSFRSGLSYGGLASPESSHLPRPGPLLGAPSHAEYDPLFAQYHHNTPRYSHGTTWFDEPQHASTTEPRLGAPSSTEPLHSGFLPDYDDAVMTPELMDAALAPFVDHAGSLDTGLLLGDDISQAGIEQSLHPELALGDTSPSPIDHTPAPGPFQHEGYSPLELIALDQNPSAEQFDLPAAHASLEEAMWNSYGLPQPEDPLDQMLALQHELLMNPPMGYGPIPPPGMMPGPG